MTVRDVLDGTGPLVTTELGVSPDVEAEMQRTIGITSVGLGATDDGERRLTRALTLYRAQRDARGCGLRALAQRGRRC